MDKATRAAAAIVAALAELDRADRARVGAEIAYEAAERAVFAALGRAIGPGEIGLDDTAFEEYEPLAEAADELDLFLRDRGVPSGYKLTYREAMTRARDADWIAGRA